MTYQRYQLIKLLYNGIVAVELEDIEDYKVGGIYYHSPQIKSIIKKIDFYKDYDGKKIQLITELV